MATTSAQDSRPDSGSLATSSPAPASVLNESFRKFSTQASALVGSSWAFLLAMATILIWAVTGPLFRFSDTWQLIINTGTTVVTFLMVFLIQNTQNRDARAIHLKLDELLRAVSHARNELIDVEEMPDETMSELKHSLQECRECGRRSEAAMHARVRSEGERRGRRGHAAARDAGGAGGGIEALCERLDRLIDVLAATDSEPRTTRAEATPTRPRVRRTKRASGPHSNALDTSGERLRGKRAKS